MYLSTVDKTNFYQRSHYIVHTYDTMGFADHFAEFDTKAQFDFFARTIGLPSKVERFHKWDDKNNSYYREFNLFVTLKEESFYTLDDIPDEAKPIKALSNGSIVTCYYLLEHSVLSFYRPNPNASPDIYDPLPIDQHIAHVKTYGSY